MCIYLYINSHQNKRKYVYINYEYRNKYFSKKPDRNTITELEQTWIYLFCI